jgi:hypothetical protein
MLNQPALGSKSKSVKSIPEFWQLLDVFWSDDQIAKSKNKIFPDPNNPATGVENCFNLICLAPHTLKPLELSIDGKTLTVQFFW